MSLDDIPNGGAVLLDANVVIHAKRGDSAQCRRLLARCAAGEVRGFVAVVAAAEFCHRRMMQEAQSLGLASSNPARALGQDRALLARLSQYRRDVEDLLSGDLTAISLETEDLLMALELQRQHGLMTNDSLQAAAAIRAGVSLIASSDPHFDQIPAMTVFKPTDIVTQGILKMKVECLPETS
jgi:predicted nucleic acid-binding protein